MVGTNCGRHGLRWQSWPNRSRSDQPRSGHPVLQVAVIRRRTEFGQGMGCCIHAVRHHQLGWQTSPTQCQTSELGDGWQLITKAITEGHIKPRGPGCPLSIQPASTPFNFHNQDLSPQPANIPAGAE